MAAGAAGTEPGKEGQRGFGQVQPPQGKSQHENTSLAWFPLISGGILRSGEEKSGGSGAGTPFSPSTAPPGRSQSLEKETGASSGLPPPQSLGTAAWRRGSTGKRGPLQSCPFPGVPRGQGDSLNQRFRINQPRTNQSPTSFPKSMIPSLAEQLPEVLENLPASFVFLKASQLQQLGRIHHQAPNHSNPPAVPHLSGCCDFPRAVSAVLKLLALLIFPQGHGLEPRARKELHLHQKTTPLHQNPIPGSEHRANPPWEAVRAPAWGRYQCWMCFLGFPDCSPGQDLVFVSWGPPARPAGPWC